MAKRPIVISINSSWNFVNFRSGLIRGLTEAGYDVIAVAPRDAYSGRLAELGCRYQPIEMNGRGTTPIQDARLLINYIRILRRERPIAYLGFTIKPNVYGSLAAHILGVPVINNIAGLGTTFLERNWLNKLVRLLYRAALGRSRLVLFQNRDDLGAFLDAGLVAQHCSDVIPGSGVDVDRFAPVARGPNAGPFCFLFVARLLWSKGVRELTDAARELRKEGWNAVVRVAGIVDEGHPDGVEGKVIRQWHEEGLIEYLGALDDVRPSMAAADCVVLPTFYPEGTPRALLEGAAMGKPLIATDVPGCRDIISDGRNGYLCPPRDAAALAARMRQMIGLLPAQLVAMGEASRTKAVQEYDERIVLARYLAALGPLAAEAG